VAVQPRSFGGDVCGDARHSRPLMTCSRWFLSEAVITLSYCCQGQVVHSRSITGCHRDHHLSRCSGRWSLVSSGTAVEGALEAGALPVVVARPGGLPVDSSITRRSRAATSRRRARSSPENGEGMPAARRRLRRTSVRLAATAKSCVCRRSGATLLSRIFPVYALLRTQGCTGCSRARDPLEISCQIGAAQEGARSSGGWMVRLIAHSGTQPEDSAEDRYPLVGVISCRQGTEKGPQALLGQGAGRGERGRHADKHFRESMTMSEMELAVEEMLRS